METRLIGGPLDGEVVTVGKTTEAVELDLGDGTRATYRLKVDGGFFYDGVRPVSKMTAAVTAATAGADKKETGTPVHRFLRQAVSTS